jgi:hypothetical protein
VVLEEDQPMMESIIRRAGYDMGKLILTGISKGHHKFSLQYSESDGRVQCEAFCKCGFKIQINNPNNYAGLKDLQMKWEKHIGTWNWWK